MKYRIVTFLVFGAAIFWLAEQNSNEYRLPFTETIDRLWLNFCIANTSDQITDAAVTLVRIDETYEPALPSDDLTRLDYAVILANIEKFNPPSASIITPLSWPEPNAINQKALETQIQKMPPLILGATVENSPVSDKEKNTTQYATLKRVEGNTSDITPFTRTVSYPEAGSLINAKAAFTEIELSNSKNPDGTLTIPLIARHGDQLIPSFILLSIVNHEKLKLDDVTVRLPPEEATGKILIGDKFIIPIDHTGQMKIYEHAAIESPLYRVVNATELPLAHSNEPEIKALQTELEDDFQSLSDNLVLIGLDRKSDQHITLNSGEKISLSKLITQSIATIQSGRYIEQWPLYGRLIGFTIIVLIASRIYRLSRRQVIIWGCLLSFLYIGACVFVFNNTLLWTPLFATLALFATLILIGIILPYHPAPVAASNSALADEKSGDDS